MKIMGPIAALALGLGLATPAAALVTPFTDPAAFEVAVPDVTVIDFEAGLEEPVYYPSPPGLTLDGVTFSIDPSVSDGYLHLVPPGYSFPTHALLSQGSMMGTVDQLTIDLPRSVTAAAFDLASFTGLDPFEISLSSGDWLTVTPALIGDSTFLGFTSTLPFDQIRITADIVAGISLDNFTLPVPAPPAAALLGLGLLALVRRRLTD